MHFHYLCENLRNRAPIVFSIGGRARKKKRLAPGGASRGLWGSDPGSGVNGSECAGNVRFAFGCMVQLDTNEKR
jgi:hypothetical protein